MSKIQFLALFFSLIFSTSAIRLSREIHEGIAYSDTDSYVQALMDQQNNFQKQISVLNKSLSSTVDSVQNSTDIGSKIDFLEKGILNQENQIYVASTKIVPKLVLKDQCDSLNSTSKQDLVKKCDNTIATLKDVIAKLQKLPQDARVLELKGNCLYQIYYLQTIQTVLRDNCTTTTILSPTMYQSNLNAVNWIAGNQSVTNLINQYIARSYQYQSITNCPLNTPFYNIQRKCINCVDPKPYFNMKTLLCQSCPVGTSFNPANHACDIKNPNATNPKFLVNTTGPIPTQSSTDVYCPAESPYYNGTNCIQCPQLFDFNTLNCTACEKYTKFNNQTRQCQKLSPNATNFSSLTPQDLFMNLPTTGNGPFDVPCPPDAPFFSNNICTDCNITYPIFNFQTNSCSNCDANSYFDIQTRNCYENQANASNLTASPNYIGVPPTAVNPVLCPNSSPFFNSTHCIACNSSYPLFNFSSNSCTKCDNSSLFDANTHKCVPLPNATNYVDGTNYIGVKPQPSPTDISCPKDQPYFNGSSCISCNSTYPLFNLSSNTCTKCDNTSSFDANTHKCVPFPNVTNYVDGPNYIGVKPQPSPTDISCPKDQPYFNGSNCTNCNQTNPYFDLMKKTCVNCPTNTLFNPTTHSCQALNPTGSNPIGLNRSIGNLKTTDIPCPQSLPFFVNGTCKNCTQPTPIFNADNSTCIACTGIYDPNLRSCLAYNWTNPNATKTIGAIPSNNTFAVYCPTNTPFYNSSSKTCFQCPSSTPLYNVSSGVCLNCPSGTIYNETTHVCDKLDSNFTNPLGQNKSFETLPTPSNYDVVCPETAPFFSIENRCISCDGATYFNLTTKTCNSCPSGLSYNVITHECSAQYTSNLKSSNWVAKNPYSALMQNASAIQNQTLTVCPILTPYYNGAKCINCVNPTPYYDIDKAICISCPQDTAFNPETYKCQKFENMTDFKKTNLSAAGANLTSSSTPLQQYKSDVAYQNKTECPSSSPYWNGNTCIPCNNPYHYFNVDFKDCVGGCKNGQFNPETGQCIDSSGTVQENPNLAALIQNAFSHEKLITHQRHRVI